MKKDDLLAKRKVFSESFSFGRCMGSKIGYSDGHPTNLIVFNSRVYDIETFKKHKDGKIKDWFAGQELELWYGDLDLSKDLYFLYLIARKIGPFVVARESGDPVVMIY